MGFKETYEAVKKNYEAGQKNFNVKCEMLEEGMQTKVDMGDGFEILIDAPEGLGGTNKGPSPLLVILGVIGACIIAVVKFWALIEDIKIEKMEIYSRGKINLSGIFGIDPNELPGYTDFEPVIRIKADAPKEKIEELLDRALKHCPVMTNMGGATPIKPRIQIQ